jgi:hypothetical protein
MKASHLLRLAGASAVIGGALRVAAAFITPEPGSTTLELLYFVIDLALLFGLFGIYASQYDGLGWLGLIGFVIAMTGLASIVGPDSDVVGINIYATATAVLGIGLAIMSVAMLLYSEMPRWIPALWIGSLLAGIAATTLPVRPQAAFLFAGVLFALGFLGAGVTLIRKPTTR